MTEAFQVRGQTEQTSGELRPLNPNKQPRTKDDDQDEIEDNKLALMGLKPRAERLRVMRLGGVSREAPAQAELRPTCAGPLDSAELIKEKTSAKMPDAMQTEQRCFDYWRLCSRADGVARTSFFGSSGDCLGSSPSDWWANPNGLFDQFANRTRCRICTRKAQGSLADSREGASGGAGKL
jgi:hypothetical protein